MSARASFKRLILRAVLRNVSPMVIRVIAVPDSLSLQEYGPLEPERFCLQEANQRLARREDSLRWRRA
jgi:hypothetical protein